MRNADRALLVAVGVGAVVACANSGPWIAPTVHAEEVAFRVRDSSPLDFLPSNQSYAWVETSRIFTGTLPRDDDVEYWPSVERLRETVDVPLAVIDWYQLPDAEARYHATILFAQRVVLLPNGPERVRADGRVDRATVPSSRVYRGVAIRRVLDGATFYFITTRGDRWTSEREIAGAVAALTLNRPSNPDGSIDANDLPSLDATLAHAGRGGRAARHAAERLVPRDDTLAACDVARRSRGRVHRNHRQ